MEENKTNGRDEIYSAKVKAGKRTYFFDVRETRGNDYYLTITESRKRFDTDGYDRHKIFLYKEDFNKFIKGLGEAIDHVKTELMPDFDFDAFNHDTPYEGEEGNSHNSNNNGIVNSKLEQSNQPLENNQETQNTITEPKISLDNGSTEEVDKW